MTHADDVRAFSPPSSAAENMTCQLLIAGGGLSGLSAAEAAMQQGLDVIVIEKSVFGQRAASGLNAGQFLTGWAKPVPTMLAELAEQGRERGLLGQLIGNFVAASILGSRSAEDNRRRRREAQRLRLFEGFPKGLRLRPGMRYQEAASPGPPTSPSTGS